MRSCDPPVFKQDTSLMTDFSTFDPTITAITAGLLLGLLWFSATRGAALMMFFQQEEYDNLRFIHWLKDKLAFDKAATAWFLGAALVSAILQAEMVAPLWQNLPFLLLLPLLFILAGVFSGAGRSLAAMRNNKKPLVRTDRVRRMLRVYHLLILGLLAALVWFASLAPYGASYHISYEENAASWLDRLEFMSLNHDWRLAIFALLAAALAQLLPFILVVTNKLLEPFEERVKARFRGEAVEKFATLSPQVVAITGSFGKTSTKHILSHILGAAAPTLATPGSVNTEMGITRVIREQLTPDHRYFVVEMGAYGPGSIARLCRLTPPDVALVTAVGAAHYERFKTLETVAKAKFEIAEAVFKKGGQTVVSTDGIPAHLLAERMSAVPGHYIKAGQNGDIALKNYSLTADGLVLTVEESGEETGEEQTLKIPLYGKHQAGNVLMAAATARALGLPWAAIKGALASVPQIRFRLEVSRSADAPTLINDAYNSNPIGFAAALECLDVLVKPTGRRILVTPGMVELGELHDAEHQRLGALAAKHADIVCVVTPDRIPSFLKGLEAANDGTTTVMTFQTQDDAEQWVKKNWTPADAVLFENNLPDLYEAEVRF